MQKDLKDRLLQALSRNRSGLPPIPRAHRDGPIGLSFAQQRLWFVSQLEGASQAYHMPAGLRLRGDLDEVALVRALDRIVYRHEVLRTRFVKAGDEPVQVIDPAGIGFALVKKDLSSTRHQDSDDQLRALIEAEASAPFDLAAGPLIRGTLVRLGEQDHALLVTMHHIISDGWSIGVLVSEFNQLYEAYCTDQPDPLPSLPIQYADYALWQKEEFEKDGFAAQARYWRERLLGAPGLLELPTDRPRPLLQDYRGDRVPLHVCADLTARLRLAAAVRGLTPFVLVLAAVAIILSRLSNQDDIVIGTPTANRRRSELERLIGFFVNTLALRIDTDGQIDAETFIEQVRQTAIAAQANQDLPFEQVVEIASPERSLSISPVFQVMFAWQNTELVTPHIAGLDLESLAYLDNTSKFDLTFDLREVGDHIEGHLEYATSLFERVTIERYSRYLTRSITGLLNALENEATAPISSIDILPQEERRLIIEGFNETQADYPSHALLHELFEVQAKASPDAVALVYGDEQLSYGELNTRANRLAHHLVSLGVKPDDRVAICVERSIEMVVGLLAILKAGGAYVPLDPAYPAERLAYMLGDCEPAIILTHAPARQALSIALGMGQDREEQDVGLPIFDLVADAALWEKAPAHAPNIRATGMTCANLAYVIYTSGSTGKPKGAMNEHGALVNRLTWMQEAYRLDETDRVLQKTPFAFDVSVWEFFWPLLAGARLVVARPDGHKEPAYLKTLIKEQGITTLHFVPSMLAWFVEAADAADCDSLRRVVCSGEALSAELGRRFRKVVGACDLHNLYGPTEAAIDVTAWTCPPDMSTTAIVPIGRPIANTRIYILDGSGAPVPIGVAGELHIAGAGVARGYLNRPELTAERFLADPFSPVCGSRMYKTGDLGRWLPDGTIEYLGRNDFQVKIRGFRIELGEIENRLTTLEGVAKAVVVAWEVDEGDDKRLVAYYTLAEGAADLEAEELRAHLAAALPDYMVPSAYVAMDALPLTPNGKLDRKALPAPDASAYARQQYEAPQGHVEQTLADIWSELLGLEQIGRHDSFFDLGGHSLLAVRMIARLSEHGLSLDVPQLFFHPVLKDLATQVAVNEGDVAPIPRAHRDGPIGLSFAQQRLWFVSQLEGASQAYHMPAGLRLRGDLDEVALVRALDRIVYRHEVLRTRFVKAGDEPVQVIDPAGIGFALVKKDLSSTRHQDSDDQLRALIEAEASAPFDLAAGPLIRGTLVRLGEQDHALLVTMHHIISDGWSIGVLVSEFNQLYEAYCTDQPDPLPSLPIQYADYALWQKEQDLTPLIDYWTGSLAGYSAPLDLSRSGQGGRAPGPARLLRRPVPQDLTAELHAFAADNNITLFMLLMTGLTLLAHRRTGRTDVAFGTTVAGRNRVELEPLIGFFINILPLRVTVEGHMSAAQLIEHVREVSIHGLNHADLPFEQLIATVPELRNSSGHALLPVLIRHQNFPQEELGGWSSNLQAQLIAFEELRPAKCDLDIQYHGDATRLETLIEYDADRFSAQEVTAILDELEQLLGRLIRQPKARVDELTAISPEETSLLADWNKTLRTFEATTIPELFARQVSASPDAVACFDKDMAYSFAELEARSNAFARLLVTRGAKPGDRIALYLPRSVDFLAALLGVFKIGGIYVAIPPSYPGNYIERILENADPSIIVTVPDLAGELTPSAETAVLTAEESHDQQSTPLETPVTWQPDQIAYIAYTSGSTAEPTGIAVPHRQFLNCLQALWDHIPFADDEVVAQKTPSAFVVSLKEMLGALLAGVPQVIISDDESRDIDRLIKSLARHRVTRLNIVPSHLAALLEHRPDLPALRHIITAGEPLTQSLRASAHTLFVGACIHNNYGCTELNDIAYSDPDEQNSRQGMSPVGRPIANTRIHILNEKLELLPIGAVGEIFVEGASIPAGYWRRPDLDDRRLVPNPIDPKSPPLFRTGDLGRWRYDGQLDYCGRSDAQTKILGQRVDLLMVEATLKLHPDIAAGAVMTQRTETGETRIVAYYVPANGKPIDPDLLRSWFSTKLPNYMLPNLYKHLDALPTLPNGKLDRRSLLSMPTDTEQALDRTPPQTDVERTIARIWSEILNIPLNTISRQDNFFALGGQSLLAVKMIARLNEKNIALDIGDMFLNPVLKDIALIACSSGISIFDPIVRADRSERLALSYGQQRLWFVSQLEGASQAYHMPAGLRLRGDLDEVALVRALDRIVYRHEVLRTRFVKAGDEPVQVIDPAGIGFALVKKDLSSTRHQDSDDQLRALIEAEASAPFDLAAGPLIRGTLVRLGEQDHALLVTMHHIISDGWSIGVLVSEFNQLYEAYCTDQPDPLPSLPIQYADYALWQKEEFEKDGFAAQARYWRERLLGAPGLLELPTDRPRPLLQDYRGDRVPLHVCADLTARLRRAAAVRGLTPFVLVLAAVAIILSRLSNQDDIVIGTPTANRRRSELERLIGFFVNTLALRIDTDGQIDAETFIEQVRQTAIAAQANQDLPFEQVVEIASPERSLSISPVFQVMFAWQNTELVTPHIAGLDLESLAYLDNTSKFDLTFDLREVGDHIEGHLEYATSLFERVTIERYSRYLTRSITGLLNALENEATAPISSIDILPQEERRLIIEGFNETQADYPSHALLHELFEVQAKASPDAVALVYGDEQLSYGELNTRANRLAHHLVSLGVKPDDRVAICVERSIEMVVGLLAILKAGGAYVPLDPAYPAERLAYMLGDCEPAIILTHAPARQALSIALGMGQDREEQDVGLPIFDLVADAALWEKAPAHAPNIRATGMTCANLAYVIYTSGSTGKPKGVMVEHRGVVNSIAAQEMFKVRGQHRVAQLASVSFDASVFEIFLALASSASLHVQGKQSQDLFDFIREERISVAVITPAALSAARDDPEFPLLETLILAGDVAHSYVVEVWNRERRVFNAYGPTEASIWSSVHLCAADSGRTPIGRPIANTRIYILDGSGAPVPIGVAGELHIAGAGVARGYLNRPELTAERFLADPFSPVCGSRMYKTGDLGRWLPDGTIEYLGRNDFQVKIRGFRIELGEIENRLTTLEGVAKAVVVAWEVDEGDDKRLVAYYTLAEGAADLEAEELRAHLAAALPDYMVPSAYVAMDALPLTPNGKLDRKALPAPDASAYARQQYEAPQGHVEQTLADIWSELLGLEQIGRHDSFFDLGGHSLLAVRMIARLKQLGLSIGIGELFRFPMLSQLALVVSEDVRELAANNGITPGITVIEPWMVPLADVSSDEIDLILSKVPGGVDNVEDIYVLSAQQRGILYHHVVARHDPFVLHTVVAIPQAGFRSFSDALQSMVDRHDVLRSLVIWEDLRQPVQIVLRNAKFDLQVVEFTSPSTDLEEQLERHVSTMAILDVRRAPLARAIAALDSANERWVIHIFFHHLMIDHTGIDLFMSEVTAFLQGCKHLLAPVTPYREHIAFMRDEENKPEHKAFFTAMLSDVEEPTLPFALSDIFLDGSEADEAHLHLPASLSARVRKTASRMGVSAASLFHVAFANVIGRLAGRCDVVFGTVLLGRFDGREVTKTSLGLFVNMLPLRVQVGDDTVAVEVEKVHRSLTDLLDHQYASPEMAQRCSGIEAPKPLFGAVLNFRHSAGRDHEARSLAALEIEVLRAQERINYPLMVAVDDLGLDFSLTAQVFRAFSASRLCGYMQQALLELVNRLERNPPLRPGLISIMPEQERRLIIEGFNETQADYPSHALLHELFEVQAKASPDAVALVYGDEQLSYGELNTRANRLAHHLVSLGVKPDDRVAICVERSIEMVVGLLAILKAGGAYVPLDPAYPAERLAYMLGDCEPAIILTHAPARQALSIALGMGQDREEQDVGLPIFDLVADAALWEKAPAHAPNIRATGMTCANLAYVIYTSGSTGKPKGVMVEHRSIVNTITHLIRTYDIKDADRLLSFSSISFDMSVEDIFSALLAGASLCLRTDDWISDPRRFTLLCEQFGITILNLPPSFWASLPLQCPATVRLVALGGEAAAKPVLLDWLAHNKEFPALFNAYGPAEAAVNAAMTRVNPERAVSNSIGRPIANTRIYILDGSGAPVPIGVAGELHIAGAGVARGYLNRPELTAERFLADPFSPVCGSRMYKTGDLGRWLPDGTIEYLGRNDFQVKIRGFRIELGEIENRLTTLEGVAKAVVVAWEVDEGDDKRLVAYYTLAEGAADLEAEELRAHLAAALPDYMVPSAYVAMDALPLTPNGKLDRKALPAPDASAYARQQYEAPQGHVEQTLADIWSELLGLEQIGRHDSFFDLGGHSLLAVRMIARLSEHGLSLDVPQLFLNPSLKVMASAVKIADTSARKNIHRMGGA